ncbi:hypothetical protein AMQ84_07035 [Paenibacillus riograndensis]|uniref:Uncharacterized protein n=1 Tax=Paenibacillus riograndensis TaxID=483937 RepID=A0A132U767_9BACL|nr:hypothetical protein AMQ84_07035 [Paenibacillus riograndensis]
MWTFGRCQSLMALLLSARPGSTEWQMLFKPWYKFPHLNHKRFYVYDSSINVYKEAAWHGRIVK